MRVAVIVCLVVAVCAAAQVLALGSFDSSSSSVFVQPELLEVGQSLEEAFTQQAAEEPVVEDFAVDEQQLVETHMEAMLPAAGQACGTGGTCTAQQIWCKAPKVAVRGLCAKNAFCCQPKAAPKPASKPAATPAKAPGDLVVSGADATAEAGDECGARKGGVCTRQRIWCPAPKQIVSLCGDNSFCCMPPMDGRPDIPPVEAPTNKPAPRAGGKTHTYNSKTGLFTFPDGSTVVGYSGRVNGYINNPAKEGVRASCQSGSQCDNTPAGPIPRGTYSITKVTHSGPRGPWTWVLVPQFATPNNRGDFRIHGANSRDSATRRVSSTGCIIFGPSYRQKIKVGTLIVY